jgi:hypothetical protein
MTLISSSALLCRVKQGSAFYDLLKDVLILKDLSSGRFF